MHAGEIRNFLVASTTYNRVTWKPAGSPRQLTPRKPLGITPGITGKARSI
jgi:hypothetical protein